MNLITNFLSDEVNHYGRLSEIISIAYLVKVLVCICGVQVICRERSRRTNLKGVLDGEQNLSLSMCPVSCWGKAVGLAAETSTGSSIMPKICTITCQRLTGQFIFNSVTKKASVYYHTRPIVGWMKGNWFYMNSLLGYISQGTVGAWKQKYICCVFVSVFLLKKFH